MPGLRQLAPDHAAALLDFELVNRAYFAAAIPDRGDDFFAHFAERLEALLAEQAEGGAAFHVLVDDDGSILGRFNLIFDGDGCATLGYRVAEQVTGRGVATAAVRELCRLAPTAYGLRRVRAASSSRNLASRRVLAKAGFRMVGPAAPGDLGGKTGEWFELLLVSPSASLE